MKKVVNRFRCREGKSVTQLSYEELHGLSNIIFVSGRALASLDYFSGLLLTASELIKTHLFDSGIALRHLTDLVPR